VLLFFFFFFFWGYKGIRALHFKGDIQSWCTLKDAISSIAIFFVEKSCKDGIRSNFSGLGFEFIF
jgi:hypothetical protein